MDPAENIARIKDNLLLIPEARFDALVQDKGYMDSFIYYLACIVLSIPFSLLVAYFTSSLIETVLVIPVSIILSVVMAYIIFGIQHLLLRLVGGKAGYLQSVQVFIYGSTPSIVFGTLPIANIIASLIGLANVVIGAARIHKISLLRSVVAILVIPTIILILIVLAALALTGQLPA